MDQKEGLEKVINRWVIVGAALVMQLCLGVLYVVRRWEQFEEDGFAVQVETGYPTQASLLFFAIGMIVAGRIQDRIGPFVAMAGGLMLLSEPR